MTKDIWQLKEGLVTKLKKNLWHHEVPGVDVDATSATDDHHSVKYCHSGNYQNKDGQKSSDILRQGATPIDAKFNSFSQST